MTHNVNPGLSGYASPNYTAYTGREPVINPTPVITVGDGQLHVAVGAPRTSAPRPIPVGAVHTSPPVTLAHMPQRNARAGQPQIGPNVIPNR